MWRAQDAVTGQSVALKVLAEIDDSMFKQRFRRETEVVAHALARLDDPQRGGRIIEVYNVDEIDGRLCVATQLVNGRSLELILNDGPLEPARAVTIIEQAATALDAAHRLGVVHRNVKPANLLVTHSGGVYLDDVYSPSNAMVGDTLRSAAETAMNPYRAPELFRSNSWDHRVDVYALACVLYHCLTGERPFPGDDLAQLITAHLTAPPPKPSALRADIPVRLDSVIARGMAKDPAERYSSATELAHAARMALGGPGVS